MQLLRHLASSWEFFVPEHSKVHRVFLERRLSIQVIHLVHRELLPLTHNSSSEHLNSGGHVNDIVYDVVSSWSTSRLANRCDPVLHWSFLSHLVFIQFINSRLKECVATYLGGWVDGPSGFYSMTQQIFHYEAFVTKYRTISAFNFLLKYFW